MKLTKAQASLLDWIGSQASGVTDISDRRTAGPLLDRGLLTYDIFQDAWRITPAGRQALEANK